MRAQSHKAALKFGTGDRTLNRTAWCLATRAKANIWAGIKIYCSVLPCLQGKNKSWFQEGPMDVKVPVGTAWGDARVGQHSGELAAKRGFGDLFRFYRIKRETGEGLGKCMRLNGGSGHWTRFKTKIRKEWLLGMDLSVRSVGYAVFGWRLVPVALPLREETAGNLESSWDPQYALCVDMSLNIWKILFE